MKIFHTVNQFIESLIDEINNCQYSEVFQEVYNSFDNADTFKNTYFTVYCTEGNIAKRGI